MRRKGWLSRQLDGTYMFSLLKPHYVEVGGTGKSDFYIQPGEPIGLRHWCPGGVKAILGIELEIGESVRVWVDGGEVDKEPVAT